jgi:hypothetical protein
MSWAPKRGNKPQSEYSGPCLRIPHVLKVMGANALDYRRGCVVLVGNGLSGSDQPRSHHSALEHCWSRGIVKSFPRPRRTEPDHPLEQVAERVSAGDFSVHAPFSVAGVWTRSFSTLSDTVNVLLDFAFAACSAGAFKKLGVEVVTASRTQ